ncbi:phosphatase PAP2 family protein [Weeksellaceae bacterium TAE3-ERU29]|nr:phosphatase PAP2 family protein [Weeksellaceae bacterium TAE3-ERU29]
MINEIILKDQELFIYLNNLGNPTWDGFWMFITNKFSAIPFYLILLFLICKKFNLKILLITLLCIALGIAFSDQLSNLFKNHLFLRLRPCYEESVYPYIRLVKDTCGGKYGYFSAHAGNNFMIATFLSLVFRNKIKYLSMFLFTWAILVAYSRIYIGVHYPLDVLTGAIIGSIIGYLIFILWNYLNTRFKLKSPVSYGFNK